MTVSYTQVVFTLTDAILLENNIRPIKGKYIVLTNPHLDVMNQASRYWKIGKNNSVVIMTDKEKKERDKYIQKHGIDGDDIFMPHKEIARPMDKPHWNDMVYRELPVADPTSIDEHYNLAIFIMIALVIVIGLQLYLVFR